MGIAKMLAVGDIHGKRYFSLFTASLKSIIGFHPDVFVLAGDIIDEGKVDDLDIILDKIQGKFPGVPIAAVFGNEEYHEVEHSLIKKRPEVIWLNDSPAILKLNGLRVGLVGTRGALEKLTYWQRRHKPELKLIYEERPYLVKDLITEVKKYSDALVLISHYAPTFLTVKGEPKKLYPYMGSRKMERVIRETKPNIVIHAHAHNARVVEARLDLIQIFNVSLPARKGITQVEIKPAKVSREVVGGLSGTTC